jgi:ubiquinone/menaquinone biosynthesis C-methylase UbiE
MCSVFAVDPSERMLEEGKRYQTLEENIKWIKGIAENIPISDNSVNLVWMSQAFHHIDDIEIAFNEIRRVLINSGYFAVRNGMRDHIDEIIWYECFPEAIDIDRNRMLSQKETIDLIVKHDFRLCASIRFYQYFADSYHEYAEKICGRGLSSLIAIIDDAFNKGVQKLSEWVNNRSEIEPVYEPVDLLIFTYK